MCSLGRCQGTGERARRAKAAVTAGQPRPGSHGPSAADRDCPAVTARLGDRNAPLVPTALLSMGRAVCLELKATLSTFSRHMAVTLMAQGTIKHAELKVTGPNGAEPVSNGPLPRH